MVERKKLGLFFAYDEKWIGGTYYILNLVHALNVLEDSKKPIITIIGRQKSDYEYVKNETSYPYLKYIKNKSAKSLMQKAVNAFSLRVFNREWVNTVLDDKFDLLFPATVGSLYLSRIDENKIVDWIPDFQDFHLPDLFPAADLVEVRQRNISKVYMSKRMVLSSEDAKIDFLKFYPDSNIQLHVIPFSVTHPSLDNIDFEMIKTKFNIDRKYFYIPNQYWVHKNHNVIIDSVSVIKKCGIDILCLFSGKEWDQRNVEYLPLLKQRVKELNLENNIKFLGFLDRAEQLLIMKNAEAIIQPSLFEGWSTVIEDAKALNKFVFASELNVHKEQLSENVVFFNPYNPEELANKLMNVNIQVKKQDYSVYIADYARKFMSLFDDK